MNRVVWLAATVLTLVLILAGGVALILTTHSVDIDVTPFKQRISDALLKRTGLAFEADGEVHLRIGPTLGLQAQGLHAKNPALSDSRDLLDTESFALEVETLVLLSGRFEPTYLRLDGASINLQLDSSGRRNWQGVSVDRADAKESASAARFLFPDALRIVAKDVRIAYEDNHAGTGFEVVLASADLEPAEDGLKIDLDAMVNGFPLQVQGRTATLSQLIEGTKPVPLDLTGNLLGLKVTAKGTLTNPRTGAQVSAALRVEGKSLAGLRPWVGAAIAARGAVKASLDLKGGGKAYEVSSFQIAIGKGRFDGALKLDLAKQKPTLDLDLAIEEVDLTRLFKDITAGSGGPAAGTKHTATDLFTEEPLSLSWMDAVNLDAQIRLRNLITPYTSMRDIDMDAALLEGKLSVRGAGKRKGRRSESFAFGLNSSVQPPVAFLHYKGDKLRLEPLLAGTQARGMIRGEVDISVDLKAAGNSANRLAGSLNGKLLFLIEDAQADLRHLDRLTPGVVNLFGQLARPNAKSAKVNCGLAAFDFQGGKTKVNALVDTPVSTVVAEGNLDLGTETLNVRVTPDAKGVNLKVAAPVVIHGPLARPDYTVEKGHLLVSLAELASKVAVPELLLMEAFGDAVAGNPCLKIASGKVDQSPEGPLEVLTQPVETVVKGAGEVVRGAGAAVKEAGGAAVERAGTLIKGVGGAMGKILGGGRRNGEASSVEDRKPSGGGAFLDE